MSCPRCNSQRWRRFAIYKDGKYIDKDWERRKCSECGHIYENPPKCRICIDELEDDWNYCPNCGERITD